ncbi:nitroreductase family protein [Lutispora thermophila]|uniref:Nitroreductase n=1 Tax=Lutispora thermophila DSM 19022 TaxID=1122184 RepID=A0A1M6EDN0_9FIRM|nr:nitroreductase family protein [Lutispora thermophila]SHI83586.1 Nitroreductase [Lutispora thermophila DSM 19022]
MKEIYTRRSIRKYENKPVTDEQINELLRAAMYAPSAGNEQPWHFVVIRDRAILDEIPKFHPYTQMLYEAPVAIVPCCDTSNLKYDGVFWIQDMSAAIQNILLEAHSMGLGTCWCGVYPREIFMEKVSEMLSLPEHVVPVAVIAVGYPGEEREVRERFRPERVHYNKW